MLVLQGRFSSDIFIIEIDVMGKYKGFSDSRRKANDRYMEAKIDQLSVYVPRGQKDVIKKAAAARGVSVKRFFVDAINNALSDNDT